MFSLGRKHAGFVRETFRDEKMNQVQIETMSAGLLLEQHCLDVS